MVSIAALLDGFRRVRRASMSRADPALKVLGHSGIERPQCLHHFERFLPSPQRHVGQSELVPGRGMVRPESRCLTKGLDSTGELPCLGVEDAEVVPGNGIVGPDLRRLPECGGRLRDSPRALIRNAEIVPGSRVVRFEPYRFPIGLDRLGESARFSIDGTEVEPDRGVSGLMPGRFEKGVYRLGEATRSQRRPRPDWTRPSV